MWAEATELRVKTSGIPVITRESFADGEGKADPARNLRALQTFEVQQRRRTYRGRSVMVGREQAECVVSQKPKEEGASRRKRTVSGAKGGSEVKEEQTGDHWS